ncbi:MAG: LOG family protein [Phycisphaerae bacterium]|nr:LOG family protein [Phycisphaerae bacterium]
MRHNAEPNRVELDPDAATVPEPRPRPDDPEVAAAIDALIARCGGSGADPTDSRLVRELIAAALKLIPDGRDTGELKLIAAAVKELRYAYRVFGAYREPHKVTIFGSARTPADHPDYAATIAFSRDMASRGWMVITGAGGGIMHAGHVGPGRDASFGVAIRLPFETTANEVIKGDQKLIHFRYFFTRKLMFLSQAEAVALLPGGFGTMDEAYEALTLIQTGKSSMVPVVMLEGEGGTYWRQWEEWTLRGLLDRHLISPEDVNLYYIAPTPAAAAEHVARFYRVYHSSRYVKDELVIRLKRPISPRDVDRLGDEFAPLIKAGRMTLRGPLEAEEDHLDLPRLVFTHTRNKFGLVRRLIDRINDCDEP